MATSTESPQALWVAILAAASVATGLAFLAIARLVSNPARIREARQQVSGLLIEMWLYGDDPGQIFRTQWALVKANARYLALLIPTALVSAPLMFGIWALLDPILGHREPFPGESMMLTLPWNGPVSAIPEPVLPAGFVLETPAVRADADRTVSWRIRAEESGVRRRFVSPQSYWEAKINYPPRRVIWAGRELSWELLLVILSLFAAVSLRARFRVQF